MRTARKVVLFTPAHAGKVFGPPLSLMALASPLRDAGFGVRIIDGVLHPDSCREVEAEIEDCLCVGISVLTGPAIRDAVAFARHVKNTRPDLPVIFGGWHPSLSPLPTLREDFVDIAARHQGERTMVEIAQRLVAGASLDFVEGCWFKRGGKVIRNADRHTLPMSGLPMPAYDLVDLDAYEARTGRRGLHYATSIGCPYACRAASRSRSRTRTGIRLSYSNRGLKGSRRITVTDCTGCATSTIPATRAPEYSCRRRPTLVRFGPSPKY